MLNLRCKSDNVDEVYVHMYMFFALLVSDRNQSKC